MERGRRIRRLIACAGVTATVAAATITFAALGRDERRDPAAPVLPSDGPLVNFGEPVGLETGEFIPGAIVSGTMLEFYNSGQSPITVDDIAPIHADPAMSLVYVTMYSTPLNGGGWFGVQGWPPKHVMQNGSATPQMVDITAPDGFPPLGRVLPSRIPDPHPPEMRTIVLACRLEPPATRGEIHDVRVTYTYEGTQYSLDASVDLAIRLDSNANPGTNDQPPSTSSQ